MPGVVSSRSPVSSHAATGCQPSQVTTVRAVLEGLGVLHRAWNRVSITSDCVRGSKR